MNDFVDEIDFKNLNVVILAGGPGNENKVSLASAQDVYNELRNTIKNLSLKEIKDLNFDLDQSVDIVFNLIHGTVGEDGALQKELSSRGIKYTGAKERSSRIAFNKFLSKEIFIDSGIPTPKFKKINLFNDDVSYKPLEFEFPCVLKPLCEGSSLGVHFVSNNKEWDHAIDDLKKYNQDIIIEEKIQGKELTVGILGEKVLPIVQIEPISGFYDLNNKYPWLNEKSDNKSENKELVEYTCPAKLDYIISKQVQEIALKSHQALGVEVYSRVDILLEEKTNIPYVLEINTIPGMTSSSLLPKAAKKYGYNYLDLCLNIIKLSLII